MQTLLRGFVYRIIYTGIGFIVSLLIAKLAGPGPFGTLSLIIVNAAIIHIITGLGTDAAIVWHGISGDGFGRDKVFSLTMITAAIQLAFFYAIALICFLLLGNSILGGSGDQKIFVAELVYFTGLVLADKFTSLYYSQHDAKYCNRMLALSTGTLLLVLFILWSAARELISIYSIEVYSLFMIIPSIVLLASFLGRFRPSMTRITSADLRSFSSFSIIVLFSNAIQFIAYRIDFWFIAYYYSHIEVGVYAQASKFAQVLWIIPGILANLAIPALRNEKQKLSDSEFVSLCRLVCFSHFIIAIFLIIASLLIYIFFLPVGYFDGYYAFLIMLPSYVLNTITIIIAAYFSAYRLLKINLFISIICCLLIMLSDFVLIPLAGYMGAAVANLVSYTIATIYAIRQFTLIAKIPFREFFVFRRSDFRLLKFKSKIIDI